MVIKLRERLDSHRPRCGRNLLEQFPLMQQQLAIILRSDILAYTLVKRARPTDTFVAEAQQKLQQDEAELEELATVDDPHLLLEAFRACVEHLMPSEQFNLASDLRALAQGDAEIRLSS